MVCSVFLVTVHDPICTDEGDLDAALYGSFLPVPSIDSFPAIDPSEYSREKGPGAVIAKKERIVINQGRDRVRLRVTNNGDRPVQVNISDKLSWTYFLPLTDGCWNRLALITISSKQTPL